MTQDSGFRITPRLVLGLFVIAAGVLFLVQELGIYDAEEIFRYWPVVLIVIGVTQLFTRGRDERCCGSGCGTGLGAFLFPIVLIVLGAWLLLNNLGIVAIEPWDYFWPILLILVGLSLILGSRRRRRFSSKADGASEVSAFCLLSGADRKVNAADFRGADLTAIMGGCELDLTQAGITESPAVIEVFALMGGIEIKVPRDWSIESRVIPLMGAVSDETRPETARPGAPRLLIKGSAIMGAVEITN